MRLQLRPKWLLLLLLAGVLAWNHWRVIGTPGWHADRAAGDWICASGDPARHSAWRLQTTRINPYQAILALDARSGAGAMRTITFLDEGEHALVGLLAWGDLEEPGQDRMQVARLTFPDAEEGVLFRLNGVPHHCQRLPANLGFPVLRDAARAFSRGGPPMRALEEGFGAVLQDAWRRAAAEKGGPDGGTSATAF